MRRQIHYLFESKQEVIALLVQLLSYSIMISCGVVLATKLVFGVNVFSETDNSIGASPRMYHHSFWSMDDNEIHQKFKNNQERIMALFSPLPPSDLYEIPDTMPHIGDKSDNYALLRQEFDDMVLPDIEQPHEFESLAMHDSNNSDQVTYDIYNCPDTPPMGYPFEWHIKDIIASWPPDDPNPRPKIFNGLCVFDFEKDHSKAMRYRNAELPFVVVNDPEIKAAAKRWNAPNYMERMLGDAKHRTEYSENNHFMYWTNIPKKKRKGKTRGHNKKDLTPDDWKQPTKPMRMAYTEWLEKANVTDMNLGPNKPHWYYRLIGCGETGPEGQCDKGSSEYLFDELPFFQPKPSLYIVEPEKQKGIHCRFGMKGVIAENHFDGSRNAIAVLGGERRYILAHPNQCENLAILPKGHPSARHSEVDWSDPDYEKFPKFKEARGNEVVLQAGDAMYLPTNWFHYIISMSLNYQCNTRSGIEQTYMPPIHACGF